MANVALDKEKPRIKNFGKTLRFFNKYSSAAQKKMILVTPFLVLYTGTFLLEPYVYRMVIDELTKGTGMSGPTILYYLLLWSAVSLAGLLIFAVYRLCFGYFIARVDHEYMEFAYGTMLNKDLRYHLDKKSGEMMKKIDRCLDALWSILFTIYIDWLPSFLALIAVLIYAFTVDWRMALVSLVMLPVSIMIFVWGAIVTGKEQTKAVEYFDTAIGRAYDSITNIMVVKSFAKEVFERLNFMEKLDKYTNLQKKTSLKWGGISVAQNVIRTLNRILVFAAGVYFIYQGSMTVGVLIMFISFLGTIYGPIFSLGDQLRNLQRSFVSVEEARKILEQKNLILDMPEAKELQVTKGEIEIRNINFSYREKDVIKGVSIEVRPGQMVALVGHSGAGKSTITALLNRFYDVTNGQILIDGQDISKVTQGSLRAQIGLVMQDNSMFNDSIYNNIAYAFADSTAEKVEDAARKANIHEFIVSQADGYQTQVGERGLKLSGGEKQRVAIARVILKNPPILILDEATSALDSQNEKVIQEALEKLMKGRTSIVIAHRLSTVRKADKIVVMDKGCVVQQGTHAELMAENGVYKDLVDLQVGGLLAA